jgi:hypothetical protein
MAELRFLKGLDPNPPQGNKIRQTVNSDLMSY